ncbi:MAG: hypothetical protein KDA24_04695 [Deltaproteobacteria bacterium]|nr:hypothetical protein [Deltaproteobacteria bacterium]
MDINDLGPLEQAALRALAHAELIGAPLTVASLWRSLPGYRTSLANVRAALEDGQPLRQYVAVEKDHYALQGRDDVLRSMAVRQGNSDARWRDLKGSLRGLGKLPWVEGVAVTGTMAWGLLDQADAPCELVILAEGGRVPLARAAVRAWRRAAGLRTEIRIAAVLDGDQLTLPEDGAAAAWWLLAVRPVVNEKAFARLRAANEWARSRFPNFDTDDAGGLPEYFLGDRVDGRLAAVRRAAVSSDDDGVLLSSEGRKELGWEVALQGAVASRPIARPCAEWVGSDGASVLPLNLRDGDARVEGRMKVVSAWTFGDAAQDVVTPSPAKKAVPAKKAAPAKKAVPAKKAPTKKAAPASKRSRGATKQRATKTRAPRPRTAASPEGGGER